MADIGKILPNVVVDFGPTKVFSRVDLNSTTENSYPGAFLNVEGQFHSTYKKHVLFDLGIAVRGELYQAKDNNNQLQAFETGNLAPALTVGLGVGKDDEGPLGIFLTLSPGFGVGNFSGAANSSIGRTTVSTTGTASAGFIVDAGPVDVKLEAGICGRIPFLDYYTTTDSSAATASVPSSLVADTAGTTLLAGVGMVFHLGK